MGLKTGRLSRPKYGQGWPGRVLRARRIMFSRGLMLTLLPGLVASSTPFGSDASCAQPSFRVRSLMAPSCAPAPSPAPDAAECGDVNAQLAPVRQAAQPSQPGQRWRVALCFYSLTRSLKLTLPSIKRHVLGPLRRTRRATVEIFLHTYNMSRGGCNGCVGSVPLDWRADVAALAEALPRHMPMRVQVDDQSQLIRRLGSEHTDAFATTWRADGEALGVAQFYLAALHSLASPQCGIRAPRPASRTTSCACCAPISSTSTRSQWPGCSPPVHATPAFSQCRHASSRQESGSTTSLRSARHARHSCTVIGSTR